MTWLKRIFGLAGRRAAFDEEIEARVRAAQGCFLTEHDAEALGAQRRVLIEQLERMIGPPKA